LQQRLLFLRVYLLLGPRRLNQARIPSTAAADGAYVQNAHFALFLDRVLLHMQWRALMVFPSTRQFGRNLSLDRHCCEQERDDKFLKTHSPLSLHNQGGLL